MTRYLPLLFACFAAGAAAGLGAQSGPGAVVAEPVHDFGVVTRGETVSHRFVIENSGDQSLELSAVLSNCACAVPEYDPAIAPGENGGIEVELDTTALSGPSAARIVATTNDPAAAELLFTVMADVRSVVQATPGYARYNVVQGFSQIARIGQVLWAPDSKDFRVLRVESSLPHVETSFREASEEEKNAFLEGKAGEGPYWWVESVLSPETPIGALSGFVKVYLDHPEQKVVPIPVSGFVRPVFAITPEQRDFGELTLEERYTEDFLVRNFAIEPIELESVECDVEGVEARFEPEEAGRRYRLFLTLDPQTLPKGPFAGTVEIHTASPRSPLLTFSIRGTHL